jgi:hypothetical protein
MSLIAAVAAAFRTLRDAGVTPGQYETVYESEG